ncbi:Cytochrome c-type biogenesis protein CcmH [Hyphomicrobium sp. ghe19]|nr:Cytochrome c-type biogenesis protein CcmH [Hyphomicrobium sp. ghe19]
MRRSMIATLLTIWALFAAAPMALAVQPGEMLADPALEQRARNISAELRCLVCQNQSIDDSDAPLAGDLRRLVRERLEAHDSDQQVLDYVVARYGEFVLLNPRFELSTILLWLTPVLVLLGGLVLVVRSAGKKDASSPSTPLTEQEKAKLDSILTDQRR